jgi:hypothetical protein
MSIWWPIAGVVVSVFALWWLWPSFSWKFHLQAACRTMVPRNRQFRAQIDSLKTTSWEWKLSSAEIVFRKGERTVLAARLQVVGSLARGRWLWAWANPSLPEIVFKAAREMVALGRDEGFTQLTTPEFACSEDDAQGLALVVAARSNASAMFSDQQGGKTVFVILHDVRAIQVSQGSPDYRV